MLNITRHEAAEFAVAVHKAVPKARAFHEDLVIRALANQINFKADDLQLEVDQHINALKRDFPTYSRSMGD